MTNIKVCRVCFAMDVRLCKMSMNSLERYYDVITGIPEKKSGYPKYVCYLCAALLMKFYLFRQKCLRSQNILDGILQNKDKVTEKDLKKVDKNSLLLRANLSKHKAMYINISAVDSALIDENVNMKIEDTSEVRRENVDLESFDDGQDFEWPSDEDIHKNKIIKEEDSITVKKEVNDEWFDVPLAKLKKAKKKSKSKKEVPKKKRGRPMQALRRNTNLPVDAVTDSDMEKYVTTVNLTIEEQFEEIQKRKESKNYLNATFRCEICFKGFLDSRTWQNHTKNHVEGVVECDICKLRFKDKYMVGKHLRRHGTKYHCKMCPYISTAVHQAKQHILWHRGVTYNCEFCDDVFTKWMSYMTHVRLKHPSDEVCGLCGYSFVSQLGLLQHKSLMHRNQDEKKEIEENVEAPFCAVCNTKFASSEAYSRHMVTARRHVETNENKHGCRTCGLSFKTSEELRCHVRGSHERRACSRPDAKRPDTRKYPMQCPHCEQEIKNARAFFWHFRKVHPDKEYPIEKGHVCEICGKAFSKNALLSYHKLTHGGERAFSCGECGKAFHIKRNLLLHALVHSDARPHVCALCGMRFKVKTVLDRHYRVHTGEKPYQCSVCGKSFTQSNSCALHVRTVHLKQPAPYLSRARRERQNKHAGMLAIGNT